MRRLLVLTLLVLATRTGWAKESLELDWRVSASAKMDHAFHLSLVNGVVSTNEPGFGTVALSENELASLQKILQAERVGVKGDRSQQPDVRLHGLFRWRSGTRKASERWDGLNAANTVLLFRLFQSPIGNEAGGGFEAWLLRARAADEALHPNHRHRIPPGAQMQEILWEHASADKLRRVLAYRFPHVVFQQHPTMNGFFVIGKRYDILLLKVVVLALDTEQFR
jgi:hypothetical protein